MTTETTNPIPSPDAKALAVDLADKLAIGEYVLARDAGLKIITQALLQHGAATAQAMREAAAMECELEKDSLLGCELTHRGCHAALDLAHSIRALPLPSQSGGGNE